MAEILLFTNSLENELKAYDDLLSKNKILQACIFLSESKFAKCEEALCEIAILQNEYGNYLLCILKCFEIIKQNPNNYIAHFLIADCLYRMAFPETASNVLQKAILKSDKYFEELEMQGCPPDLLDAYESSMSYLREKFDDVLYEDINGETERAFSVLLKAEKIFESGNCGDEIDFLEKSGCLSNEIVAMHYVGCLIENAEFEKAKIFCINASDVFPDTQIFNAELIFLEYITGKTSKAFEIVEQASKLDILDGDAARFLHNAKSTCSDKLILAVSQMILKKTSLFVPALLSEAIANYNLGKFDVALSGFENLKKFADNYCLTSYICEYIKKEKNRKNKLNYGLMLPKEEFNRCMKKLQKLFVSDIKWSKEFEVFFQICFCHQNYEFAYLPLDSFLKHADYKIFCDTVLADSFVDDGEKFTLIEALFYRKNLQSFATLLQSDLFLLNFFYPDNFETYNSNIRSVYSIAATMVAVAAPDSSENLIKSFNELAPLFEQESIRISQEKYYALTLIVNSRIENLKTVGQLLKLMEFSKPIIKKYIEKFCKFFNS